MSNNNSGSAGGIGLLSALFLVFLTLKLCSVIDWSWWWVTAPLWGPTIIVLGIIGLMGIAFVMLVSLGAIIQLISKK